MLQIVITIYFFVNCVGDFHRNFLVSWFVTVCVRDFHDLCPWLSPQGSFSKSRRNGIWTVTRVDDLNWLFNQALIQALFYSRRAGYIWDRPRALTHVNARSGNAPLDSAHPGINITNIPIMYLCIFTFSPVTFNHFYWLCTKSSHKNLLWLFTSWIVFNNTYAANYNNYIFLNVEMPEQSKK